MPSCEGEGSCGGSFYAEAIKQSCWQELYPEYCKFALAKFRPWPGNYGNDWIIFDVELEEQDQEELVSLWENFLVELREAGREESEGDFVNTEPANVDVSDDSDLDSTQDDFMKATYMTFAGNSKFKEEDEMAVEWSMDHDFLMLENDYEQEMSHQFNKKQVLAHDTIIVRLTLQEPDIVAENGGIGKLTTMKIKEGWVEDNYAVFVTAGLTAMNVHIRMVHSWKEGLGLSVGLMK
eukprot:scaffold306817_cov67-Attheya_sp.AAC.2